ncbi:hypothetical protein BJY52DRAFT_1416454 [Lactarius psammicola]|nr:hypothetical protein BJY52DRAFT_1416454 [Lactarius psammicola]
MMQRFLVLVLAASVALLGTIVPVEAALLGRHETNGQRFARGLPPLPPVRRSPTDTAKRRQVSPLPGSPLIGRLEVHRVDGTVLGYVANDKTRGPVGLNIFGDPNPAYLDLTVELSGSNLLAQKPEFVDPYYIGGYGDDILSPHNSNTVQFINVAAGLDAAIWTLDKTSGALNATWTNVDGSKIQPTLIYDVNLNVLSFTANPTGVFNLRKLAPVTIFFLKEDAN